MKLTILAALAALALSGAAIAQPGRPDVPMAGDFEGNSPPSVKVSGTPDVLRSVQRASSQLQMACAADREKLCADTKTSFSASRCLERHRRDVKAACNSALNQAAVAWNTPVPH
jgi:hypothetical protein